MGAHGADASSVDLPNPAEELSQFKNMSFDQVINAIATDLAHFAISLAAAILVFYAGKFVINRLYNFTDRLLRRRNVEASLLTFVLSFVRIVLYFILIVAVIGILGIETSSFLALFASAGVAIGMALSGTLQNFAGGVLILALKPFKVGDYIEAQGFAGTVKKIEMFSTIITTPDYKTIIIPNGGLSTGAINNSTTQHYRRVGGRSVSLTVTVWSAPARPYSRYLPPTRVCSPSRFRTRVWCPCGISRLARRLGRDPLDTRLGQKRRLLGSVFRYERDYLQPSARTGRRILPLPAGGCPHELRLTGR